MKISQLMNALDEIKSEHGDMAVLVYVDTGHFCGSISLLGAEYREKNEWHDERAVIQAS